MPSVEVQRLVDELADRLRRSVVIDDVDLALLYSSPHYGDEDAVRVQSMLKRRTSSQAIGYVLATGVLSWTRPGIIPANDELGLHARVCVPVRWQGELIAFLMVMDSDGTVTTAQTRDISSVADLVAPLLVAEMRVGEAAAEQTILDLVGSESVLRRQALADMAGVGEAVENFEFTAIRLLVRADDAVASAGHVTVALRQALSVAVPTGIDFQRHAVNQPHGVVVLGGHRPLTPGSGKMHAERMVARVHDLAAGHFHAYAGIGPSVTGLVRVHESAELAGLAVRAAELGIVQPAARWDELGTYGPLLRVPEDQMGRLALPAEVQRLLDIDREGLLLQTLRVYLDAAGAASVAAGALQIHRTTLYYRLSRVEELLGVDLADGRTRLTLHVGVTMLDLMPHLRQM
jgi:hypothetical protein